MRDGTAPSGREDHPADAARRRVPQDLRPDLDPIADTATDRSKTIAANRITALTRLFVDADTNAEIRGTRWAGYQAVTEYLDHAAPVQGKTIGDKAVNRALRSIDASVVEVKEWASALLSV